jgi:hypothetical protein
MPVPAPISGAAGERVTMGSTSDHHGTLTGNGPIAPR